MWSGRFLRARFGRKVLVLVAWPLSIVVFGLACSGRSETIVLPPEESGTGGTDPGTGGSASGRGGTGGGGRDAGPDASDAAADASEDGGEEPFEDPGCPDLPAPEGVVECDIFGTPTGCPEGTGCYPDLTHPFGSGCDQQTLDIVCRAAGSGLEGDLCGTGTGGCAPGFTCIVGAEAGKRCLRICSPTGGLACPPGAVCGETDARGIGVCA